MRRRGGRISGRSSLVHAQKMPCGESRNTSRRFRSQLSLAEPLSRGLLPATRHAHGHAMQCIKYHKIGVVNSHYLCATWGEASEQWPQKRRCDHCDRNATCVSKFGPNRKPDERRWTPFAAGLLALARPLELASAAVS